jgi:16S rRNA (cytosine1402-N4)-methyltransferase
MTLNGSLDSSTDIGGRIGGGIGTITNTINIAGAKNYPKSKELDNIKEETQGTYFKDIMKIIKRDIKLKKLLEDSVDLLNTGGRIAVISYHSIEDRLVKNFFKKGNFEGKEVRDFYGNLQRPFDEINRHPIVPTEAEVLTNNRARSAKLRIAQKQ